MIRFGVIGYGYWGPNVVRDLRALDSVKVVAVCDKSEAAVRRAKQAFPEVGVTTDCDELLSVAGHRCDRRDHTGVDALRAGKGGPAKRQARVLSRSRSPLPPRKPRS